MKTTLLVLLFFLFQFGLYSCSDPKKNKIEAPIPVTKLSEVTYQLPDRPGRELLLANCGICHSFRYIQMQPNFPRKTWEKTVDKMIKTFGAPVPDSLTAKRIVDYLVSIKGIH